MLAGFAGIVWVGVDFIKRPLAFIRNTRERNFLLYLMAFFGPVLAVIVMHSTIYDDWRHLYFVYPPFVMLALYCINKFMDTRYRNYVLGACGLQLAIVAIFMVSNFPFSQVYFNNFVSHQDEYLRKNYEMEYWGCSYKQALEHILEKAGPGEIKVAGNYPDPIANNMLILPEEDRNRIKITDEDHADYLLTNYRAHPYDYPPYDVAYSIKVLNSTIMSVFRLEKDPAKMREINMKYIDVLKQALVTRTYSEEFAIHAQMADCYSKIGMFDSAYAHFMRAIELRPENMQINEIAVMFNKHGQYALAIKLLYKALEKEPNFVTAHYNIGCNYTQLGRYDSALYHLGRALELDPKFPDANMQVAFVYYYRQQLDKAETYFKREMEVSPQSVNPANNLGAIYLKAGKYAAAAQMLEKAIAINPRDVNPYPNLGLCFLRMGRHDSALHYLYRGIAIEPRYNANYENMAVTYKAMGKTDSAAKYEAIARRTDPGFKL